MKKQYEAVEMEVIQFAEADVIVTSGGGGDIDPGEWD